MSAAENIVEEYLLEYELDSYAELFDSLGVNCLDEAIIEINKLKASQDILNKIMLIVESDSKKPLNMLRKLKEILSDTE